MMRHPVPLFRHITAMGIAVIALVATFPAMAQNPFSAAVRVNDNVVTHYEIEQRALFLQAIRAPGDVRTQALEDLVNERLQTQMAARMEVLATSEDIEAGIAEFASRLNLGPSEFIRQLGQAGVAPETFRDFVANGLHWRNVVQQRFGPVVRISDTDVDENVEFATSLDDAEILLAEIVVPITPQNQDILQEEIGRLSRDLNGDIETFSLAAEQFSAAATRENGGLTGWRPFSAIPPALREYFLTLRPGETSQPIVLGPAYAIFQMRGIRQVDFRRPSVTAIEYATISLSGGRTPQGMAAANALRGAVDVCDDLYGRQGSPFEIQTQAPGAIPADIAMVLSTLDAGEMSFDLTREDGAILLGVMLCDRELGEPEGGVEALRQSLFAQELESYAAGLLEELRADAIIVYDP